MLKVYIQWCKSWNMDYGYSNVTQIETNVYYRSHDFAIIKTQTKTRSTQRAQTSLAEADHYSHIAHCKNVEPWW